jgi:predicted SnoaL-like aldol condensation-catalyzing enzyme
MVGALIASCACSLWLRNDPATMRTWANADYISAERYDQHNPHIKDGLAGLVEAVEHLVAQENMFKYTKIHKVLGEGDFVLVVSEGQWNGTTNAFYDLLRFENGQAVEHWDVIQPVPVEGLANHNTMFGF